MGSISPTRRQPKKPNFRPVKCRKVIRVRVKTRALLITTLIGFGLVAAKWFVADRPGMRAPASSYSWEECNVFEMANQINQGDRVPAGSIYHFGKKEILMKDVEANQVPTDAWEKFIMGDETRFRLKPFRRGLYGTEYLEDADKFGSDIYNWIIEIQIKSECRLPKYVGTIDGLAAQSKFKKWYGRKQSAKTIEEWTKLCFLSSGQSNSAMFDFYESNSNEQNECESVVSQYWTENDVRVVQDTMITRSWYIRDRNCIENIRGSNFYLADRFLVEPKLWENQCDHYRTHHNAVRVWFGALSKLSPEELAQLSFSNFKNMLIRIQMPVSRGDDDLSVYDFSNELVASFERCSSFKKLPEWQHRLSALSSEIDGMTSSEVKERLGSVCQ